MQTTFSSFGSDGTQFPHDNCPPAPECRPRSGPLPCHAFSEPFPLSSAQTSVDDNEERLGAIPTTPTVLPYNVVAALPTDPRALEKELVDQYENGHLDVGQTLDLAACRGLPTTGPLSLTSQTSPGWKCRFLSTM